MAQAGASESSGFFGLPGCYHRFGHRPKTAGIIHSYFPVLHFPVLVFPTPLCPFRNDGASAVITKWTKWSPTEKCRTGKYGSLIPRYLPEAVLTRRNPMLRDPCPERSRYDDWQCVAASSQAPPRRTWYPDRWEISIRALPSD